YTFTQFRRDQSGSQSRIDRFHITREIFDQSFEWKIQTTGIYTDHRMISLRLTYKDAPTTGPG
ncbi:hypothetical protein R3P38DRAFT_2354481, partial [Favolaschia claudopus]